MMMTVSDKILLFLLLLSSDQISHRATALPYRDQILTDAETEVRADGTTRSWTAPAMPPQLTAGAVLARHGNDSERAPPTRLACEALAFTTPWNAGRATVVLARHRYSYASPVWLQLRPLTVGAGAVHGTTDVDAAWAAGLRANGTKVLPRLLLDGFSDAQLLDLIVDDGGGAASAAVAAVSRLVRRHGWDGIVLELGIGAKLQVVQALQGRGELPPRSSGGMPPDPPLGRSPANFVRLLGDALRKDNADALLFLVAPAHPWLFSAADWTAVRPHVDRLVLMTYDYSQGLPQSEVGPKEHPNAPLGWVRLVVQSLLGASSTGDDRVLLGINYYGRRFDANGFGGEPVVGHEYLDFLRLLPPDHQLIWDERWAEHYVVSTGEGNVPASVYYHPTAESVSARVRLALEMGLAGVSVWEVGQGLDQFDKALYAA